MRQILGDIKYSEYRLWVILPFKYSMCITWKLSIADVVFHTPWLVMMLIHILISVNACPFAHSIILVITFNEPLRFHELLYRILPATRSIKPRLNPIGQSWDICGFFHLVCFVYSHAFTAHTLYLLLYTYSPILVDYCASISDQTTHYSRRYEFINKARKMGAHKSIFEPSRVHDTVSSALFKFLIEIFFCVLQRPWRFSTAILCRFIISSMSAFPYIKPLVSTCYFFVYRHDTRLSENPT